MIWHERVRCWFGRSEGNTNWLVIVTWLLIFVLGCIFGRFLL